MDAFELFRKLGAGAKFDLKRFGQDASRFKVGLLCVFDDLLDGKKYLLDANRNYSFEFWLLVSTRRD